MSDGEIVARTVAHARRRLITATFVQWASATMAAGIVGLVAVAVVGNVTFAFGRPLLTIGAIALLLATAMTAWRRPSRAQTAAALDVRLGLADLAVAALALRDSTQPMAQLVVRDARLRLGTVSLPRVIPMPRRLVTWACGTSIAALALGALAGGGRAPVGNLIPAGGTGRVVSGGSAAQPGREVTSSGVATPVGRSSAARPQRVPVEDENRPPSTQTPAAATAAAARTDSAGRGQQAGASGANGASDDPGRTAARSGNAGRGATDSQAATGSAAGGVQHGTVARPAATEPAQRAEAPLTVADVRQSASQAEAALARDEVPPRLRPLVRRYFQSMQAESDR